MTAVCSQCGASRETKGNRIPGGWKRRDGVLFCGKCWGAGFILRAVTIPVATPLDCTWKEFMTVLRSMWAVTTQAYNFAMTEMYARDIRREAQAEKMAPMPKMYLYPDLRDRFPVLPPQSRVAIEHAAAGKYRAKRYDVIWTCAASLPTYRYPTPFPVHNQSWSVEMEGEFAIVTARIGETKMRLRLRGGARFRRQMAAVKQMVTGAAERGQCDLFESGDHIMCKMVAWLPRKAAGVKDGTLFVRSAEDAMVTALNEKDDKLWVYHGDQIPRWAAEHRRRIQNWSDDSKAEHRPVPPFAERRAEAARKYRHRTATAAHQIAAMVVGYAVRRKFRRIEWDDTVKSFAPQFPWFDLRMKLETKADADGIEFEYTGSASDAAVKDTQSPLADK